MSTLNFDDIKISEDIDYEDDSELGGGNVG